MSKSKYALKTTKIIYAVWLEIYAAWLGIYAVSVCHLFGRGLYPYQTSEKSVYPIIISKYYPFIRIYTWIHHYTILLSQVSESYPFFYPRKINVYHTHPSCVKHAVEPQASCQPSPFCVPKLWPSPWWATCRRRRRRFKSRSRRAWTVAENKWLNSIYVIW